MIRPRAAQFGPFLGEHAAHLVDPFEVAVAEAVQPVADLRLELEVIQAPYPAAHAWLGYRLTGRTPQSLTGLSDAALGLSAPAVAMSASGSGQAPRGMPPGTRDRIAASGLEHSHISVANDISEA